MRNRWILAGVILFVLMGHLFSQEEKKEIPPGWQKEAVADLNFTQNSFDNWTQGGENSWSWQFNFNARFVNEQPKYRWANTGKITYGQTRVGSQSARKAADEIRFESVLTYKAKKYINPFISFIGITQLTRGYKYTDDQKLALSDFMDPGYFTQSIGLGYKDGEMFQTRLGAALKETITRNYPVPYADDPATTKIEKTKVEYGAESITDFRMKVSENILFTSKLEMFSNLERLDEVDVNWDNVFVAKVAKYMNVTFNIRLYYDKDVSLKRQIKQTLAVGLTYSLL